MRAVRRAACQQQSHGHQHCPGDHDLELVVQPRRAGFGADGLHEGGDRRVGQHPANEAADGAQNAQEQVPSGQQCDSQSGHPRCHQGHGGDVQDGCEGVGESGHGAVCCRDHDELEDPAESARGQGGGGGTEEFR